MAADWTCALPGCSRLPRPSLDPSKPHLTCGHLHHLLLMAARFHPNLSEPAHQQIFHRNAAGLCGLHSCSDLPEAGCSWCSRSHYLVWLSDFTSHLLPDQICKLPGCIRHVYVDEKLSRSEYCGWRHCQKDVMRSAMKHHHQQLPQQENSSSSPRPVENRSVLLPSVESLVVSLRDYALLGVTPANIKVDEDFFNKHPWEVCTGSATCWLFAQFKFTSKMRVVRMTKESYHWKQQGPPQNKSGYSLKYFTYQKMKGDSEKCTYFMDEYTVKDVHRFALLRLHSGSGCSRKHCKGPNPPSAEVNDGDVQAQDAALQSQDDMDASSYFWECLSPLHSASMTVVSWDDNLSREIVV